MAPIRSIPVIPRPRVQRSLLARAGSWTFGVFLMMIGLPALTAVTFRTEEPSYVSGWSHTADADVSVRVLNDNNGKVEAIPLNDYILSVITAEYAASTPLQALEAAAIAARTYAVQAKLSAPSQKTFASKHGADVTNSPALDLPMSMFSSLGGSASQGGSGFPMSTPPMSPVQLANYQTAVEATDGLILTYHGSPILAFMFPMSNGRTRDASEVFGSAIPYLKSVLCPADAPPRVNRMQYVFTPKQWIQKFGESQVESVGSMTETAGSSRSSGSSGISSTSIDPSAKIESVAQDGYVRTVKVGPTLLTGEQFVQKTGISSDDFTISQGRNQSIDITTYGTGTGLGMSLHQATAFAKSGATWNQILSTFYPGTESILDARVLQS